MKLKKNRESKLNLNIELYSLEQGQEKQKVTLADRGSMYPYMLYSLSGSWSCPVT